MTFIYIDDSQIKIRSIEHIILTALIVREPSKIYDEVLRIRGKNSIQVFQEFKVASALVNNDNGFLEDVIQVITSCTDTCLCAISQTLDKHAAAKLLLDQIIEYCKENSINKVYLLFDNGIVRKKFEKELQEKDHDQIIIGFQNLDSKYDYGIQIADWFVTQFKTFLAFLLKDQDKSIIINDIDGKTQTSYIFFSNMAIRYHWWGAILNGEMKDDFSMGQSPYKYIVGKGIKVNSIDEVQKVIDTITTVYFGCIH